MGRQRIAITGIGVVSALGWSVSETWGAMLEGRSGLGPLSLFESPRNGHFPVGQIIGEPAEHTGLRGLSRTDHFAVIAAREAAAHAGLALLSVDEREQIAVVLGASTGGMLDSEVYLQKLLREGTMSLEHTRRHECAWSADAIAEDIGTTGIVMTLCTACASGGTAISTAIDVLRSGDAPAVICGGVDSLTRLTLNGFASLLVVSDDGCRPFDADRRGMSLGEGAGLLVLELEEHAKEREAEILGYIAGVGNTCDSHHATAPAPDGSGIRRAMEAAIANAEIDLKQIGYINAHGTGTADNDPAEGAAIHALFGDNAPPVSSTKRYTGHTLSAAGAIEAIVCLLALREGKLPANLGLRNRDEAILFEVLKETRASDAKYAISNSLGFGGANCSVLVGKG